LGARGCRLLVGPQKIKCCGAGATPQCFLYHEAELDTGV